MNIIKKFFCAIVEALNAVFSFDEYRDLLLGHLDEIHDEHEECW